MFGFVHTFIRMSHYFAMTLFTDTYVRFEIKELRMKSVVCVAINTSPNY